MKNLLISSLAALAFALAPVACDARTTHHASPTPAASEHGARPYTKLEHVQYLRNLYDDGDSFHVRATGKEYIFRLYFVDTPETDMSFPTRVQEQAKYFGITTADALRVGKIAADFTKQHLSAHPFTVYTRWHDAKGRSRLERFYGHIFVEDQNLAELLVANGLARIYGMHANLPDGTHASAFEAHLRELEQKAKSEHLGAWGVKGKAASAQFSALVPI
jgi:endonuclease YncB( thermonuclease family)